MPALRRTCLALLAHLLGALVAATPATAQTVAWDVPMTRVGEAHSLAGDGDANGPERFAHAGGGHVAHAGELRFDRNALFVASYDTTGARRFHRRIDTYSFPEIA